MRCHRDLSACVRRLRWNLRGFVPSWHFDGGKFVPPSRRVHHRGPRLCFPRRTGAGSGQGAGLGAPPTLRLPAIQKRQLSNGLPVWIVELHEVPVAQVNLVVTERQRRRSRGEVRRRDDLTAAMLQEGAGSRSSLETRRRRRFPRRRSQRPAAPSIPPPSACTSRSRASRTRCRIMADVALRPTFPNRRARPPAPAAPDGDRCRRATIRRPSRAPRSPGCSTARLTATARAHDGTRGDDAGAHHRRPARALHAASLRQRRRPDRRRRCGAGQGAAAA